MANKVSGVAVAPGLMAPTPNVQGPQGGVRTIPFRQATLRKCEQAMQDSIAMTVGGQLLNRVLEGTGFLESVDLEVVAAAAGNLAAVAFDPDGPWNALSNIVFKDVGPDIINITGYGAYLAALYGGYGAGNLAASLDTSVYNVVTGAVATGGSFRTRYRIPLAINARSLIGLMGNQDRAVKYELRSDLSPSGSVYTVAPTALPTLTINRTLNYCTVPASQNDLGKPQVQLPPSYGVIHTLTELQSESAPVSASTINHFLRSIGNTFRYIILVLRDSTGARSDLMLPSKITFRVGQDAIFSESGAHRRQVMYDRYGFDAPAGVLVYDFISDFVNHAGFELGDDWLSTENIPNAQFEVTYPTFVSTPGTMKIITDALTIPAGMDLTQFV